MVCKCGIYTLQLQCATHSDAACPLIELLAIMQVGLIVLHCPGLKLLQQFACVRVLQQVHI
jgi:hypothetical protein